MIYSFFKERFLVTQRTGAGIDIRGRHERLWSRASNYARGIAQTAEMKIEN